MLFKWSQLRSDTLCTIWMDEFRRLTADAVVLSDDDDTLYEIRELERLAPHDKTDVPISVVSFDDRMGLLMRFSLKPKWVSTVFHCDPWDIPDTHKTACFNALREAAMRIDIKYHHFDVFLDDEDADGIGAILLFIDKPTLENIDLPSIIEEISDIVFVTDVAYIVYSALPEIVPIPLGGWVLLHTKTSDPLWCKHYAFLERDEAELYVERIIAREHGRALLRRSKLDVEVCKDPVMCWTLTATSQLSDGVKDDVRQETHVWRLLEV